jgi:replicative superfamily II helicase
MLETTEQIDHEQLIASLQKDYSNLSVRIRESHSIKIGDRSEVLTDFQHSLWQDVNSQSSVAFSAPTSGGKSFVLELYLASLFNTRNRSVIYLVPTRALITQVSSELGALFRNHGQTAPDIITVPLRSNSETSNRVIYVMTQERVHLS